MTATVVATKRAVCYRRVSTQKQAGERHSSLPEQEAHIRAYCAEHTLDLQAELYTDVASGRRDDHANYRRMVAHALNGGADVVIVQWLDRFGRNAREILKRVWELQEAGVEVVTTDEDVREELMLLLKAGIAAQESRRIAERIRENLVSAAKRGTHFGRAPFGYRRILNPDGRVTYEQDLAEAAAVREMVRLMVEENLGQHTTANRLNAGGFVSRKGVWTADTIRRVLANEALVGTLRYNKKPRKNPTAELVEITGFFNPSVLDPEQWQAVQARLGREPRGRVLTSDYLLSGIARCGQCGGPMVGKRSYGRRDRNGQLRQYRNYWCSNTQRARDLCGVYNGHAAHKLERAILEHLAQYDDADRVRDLLAESHERGSAAAADELRHIEHRLGELERDFHQNLDLLKRGVLDEDDFTRANNARKLERTELQTRRDQIAGQLKQQRSRDAAVAALPARVRGFLEDVERLEVRKAKALLQSILGAAYVYRDGRIDLEFRHVHGP